MWPGANESKTVSPKSFPNASTTSVPSLPHSPSQLSRTATQPSRSPRPHLWNLGLGASQQSTTTSNSAAPLDSPSAQTESEYPGALSPAATDRVFPIRSVVSVDPTPTPLPTPSIRSDGGREDGFFRSHYPSDVIPSRRPDSRRVSKAMLPSNEQASEASSTPSRPSRGIHGGLSFSNDTTSVAKQPGSMPSRPSESFNNLTRGSSLISSQLRVLNDDASGTSGSDWGGGRSNSALSEAGSVRSVADSTGGLVTARFKHTVMEGGHAVITGRDGDVLQRCEDEPIHIPGAIQGFGLLIALSEMDDRLVVRIVSENSKRVIGYSPRELFKLESFTDILSDEQADNLLDHLDFIKDDTVHVGTHGPEVFVLAIRPPTQRIRKLWCAMHINISNPDMIICEFELEEDPDFPLVPPESATPEPPEDTLNSNPTPEELHESTSSSSKPLRVLRSARRRRGEAAAMEVFNIMSQVQEQLASAPNLDKFLKVLAGVVKELTGFHRVMVYQFDSSWSGRVVTELVDPRATKDLYKGLNFPASDIPKQARELYKINKVRLLYDRDQETARLVCRTLEDLETPLDLTYSYLRAMSPIHIKYLTNMAVRSSMSISINAFDELWGLVSCHSYGAKGMRVSFPIRKMCRLVGDSASRNIERLSYASRLQARKLINTVPTESNPSGYIIASSDDLLKLFQADYGLLSVRDETKILGKLEQTQEALAMLEYLRLRKINSVVASQDIRVDFPDLRYPPGFTFLAGLLFVPLSVGGTDFIVFFRKGQEQEVKWAGNPYEKFFKEGTDGYLEPRKSFKTWSETVVGKCKEWTEEQIETAAVLCLVYGKFIEVWREKEAALQNSQLTRLLLSNSAHEVRTPLNAIINYLEIAMEGSLDAETRENLSRSHSASKSLIYVINDLLDLTKTEEGNNLIKDETFDLPGTVREAADMFSRDAKRKNIDFQVIRNPGVPQLVVGDQRKVRQAISNITANAIQHTEKGFVKVEMWLAEKKENHVEVDIVVQDTGAGMSSKMLDALFRDLEQVQSESDEMLQETLAPDTQALTTGKSEKRALGLGLAVVARVVRNMNGQLRLKSEEGKGSRFVMQLGFELPHQGDKASIADTQSEGSVGPPAGHPSTPPVEVGEVFLVNKSAQRATERQRGVMSRRASGESMVSNKSANSLKSFRSGSSARSDVDRLIGAIQESHLTPKPTTTDIQSRTKSVSRASRAERASSLKSGRPALPRSHTSSGLAYDSKELLQSTQSTVPGEMVVVDSAIPIKPVKMPESANLDTPTAVASRRRGSKVLFEIPDQPLERIAPPTADHLNVLVAEDDPINSRIIKKRLEKYGHEVYLTVNGEECATAYGDKAAFFDVVLMDMQMPIVDGLTSTKMIRSFEKLNPSSALSRRASMIGRVPVFAVSASLVEKNRQSYIDAGFDGWILKPIDFKRLAVLLSGIVEKETRESCLYKPGKWEKGGWFSSNQPDTYSAYTKPSRLSSASSLKMKSYPDRGDDPFDDPISEEQARLERGSIKSSLQDDASVFTEESTRSKDTNC